MLSPAYGSLPHQFGGVLAGLPGSFAACGTRHVCTTHRTQSCCEECRLTLDKLPMNPILSALETRAWHATASGLFRVCVEGLLSSCVCRKNATTCTGRKTLAAGSAHSTAKICSYGGLQASKAARHKRPAVQPDHAILIDALLEAAERSHKGRQEAKLIDERRSIC
jgi:hypothetical protein